MPRTYEPIATTTLGSNQASVTFSAIDQTFTDLLIIASIKVTAGGLVFKPNANNSSIYSGTQLYGDGSSATSNRLTTAQLGGTGLYLPNGSVSTTEFTVVHLHFQNYSNTTTNKTVISRYANSQSRTGAGAHLAATTSAISSLVFSCDGGGNIASGTVITLYGIKAA